MGRYKEAESIMDKYVKGTASAAKTKKSLRASGFNADLRSFLDNRIEIIDIKMNGGFELEMAEGGLATKKYMNPVKIIDNRKNK